MPFGRLGDVAGRFGNFLVNPLVDVPDLPGGRFGELIEGGIEDFSSPLSLALLAAAPVTGGGSLAARGALAGGRLGGGRLAGRLAATSPVRSAFRDIGIEAATGIGGGAAARGLGELGREANLPEPLRRLTQGTGLVLGSAIGRRAAGGSTILDDLDLLRQRPRGARKPPRGTPKPPTGETAEEAVRRRMGTPRKVGIQPEDDVQARIAARRAEMQRAREEGARLRGEQNFRNVNEMLSADASVREIREAAERTVLTPEELSAVNSQLRVNSVFAEPEEIFEVGKFVISVDNSRPFIVTELVDREGQQIATLVPYNSGLDIANTVIRSDDLHKFVPIVPSLGIRRTILQAALDRSRNPLGQDEVSVILRKIEPILTKNLAESF